MMRRITRHSRVTAAVILGAATMFGAATPAGAGKLPNGFVYLGDVAPGIVEDMRYATSNNFTGRPVPGYLAGRCILAKPVAAALARVQARVARQGYAIKVYDCYRPVRAVKAFVRWARSGADGGAATKSYYPRIARSRIMALGYIAGRSSHSRGTAVDVTLVRAGAADAARRAPTAKLDVRPPARSALRSAATCIADEAARAPDSSIDMGTAWDCFDVKSHTYHLGISRAAAANRRRLLGAMSAEGFRNYKREWWHFSLALKGYRRAHTFPVD